MVSDINCNFEKALKLCKKNFSYNELIILLKQDNIVEKQFAVLNLTELKTKKDASLLCSNLTGQDGKVREAVAFKLSEFFQNENYAELFYDENNFNILLEGLMDINGNVCRFILDIEDKNFLNFLSKNLVNKINFILEDISKLKTDDKQYVISKRNFQLYWALEGLYKVLYLMEFSDIKSLLLKTALIDDYTIKEKTAKILSFFHNPDCLEIQKILKQNSNYYVERYLS